MSDTARLLESLRDVREPLPPEGAPLWMIGANLLAITIVILLLWHLRTKHRFGWRKQLINDLRKARQQTPEQAVMTAATVLRQLSLARGETVQSIHGEPWLQHLDSQFDTDWFTQGNGRLLGDALYRSATTDSKRVSSMLEELENLIQAQSFQPTRTISSA